MILKMLAAFAGGFTCNVGDLCDRPDDEAERLIAAGFALRANKREVTEFAEAQKAKAEAERLAAEAEAKAAADPLAAEAEAKAEADRLAAEAAAAAPAAPAGE